MGRVWRAVSEVFEAHELVVRQEKCQDGARTLEHTRVALGVRKNAGPDFGRGCERARSLKGGVRRIRRALRGSISPGHVVRWGYLRVRQCLGVGQWCAGTGLGRAPEKNTGARGAWGACDIARDSSFVGDTMGSVTIRGSVPIAYLSVPRLMAGLCGCAGLRCARGASRLILDRRVREGTPVVFGGLPAGVDASTREGWISVARGLRCDQER